MYFAKRLAAMVPLLLVISMLAFLLIHVAPGGPFDKERAPASPEIKRNIEAKYHLNEPLFIETVTAAAADAGRRVQLLEKRAQANDHAILLGVPESHYLKCLILRVLE